ncbi:MAG: hypothetical protein CVU85_05955 [Firmicutes bacterium HGW-Firmicutes-10]|jgi:hypothetical protein|nr:MAG: hypothetical protein CVU85_05955 [Firmicutes bacterium HGW-Firmicutes-10]
MKEIIECYKVDTITLQRNDGFWLSEGRLILRSINVGELVEDRYQSPFAEARFSLSEEDTQSMMLLLDADQDSLAYRLKQHFEGAAVLDRFKRFCDENKLKYHYQFITG